MSQRECAGFNWPPLSIAASEPVRISPEAVSRTGPTIDAAIDKSCGDPLRSISDNAPPNVRTFFSPSAARGVGHPHNATVFLLLSLFPAALLPFCAGVPAIGVGQPAMLATCGSATDTFLPSGIRPVALIPSHDCDPFAFPAVGVGQPANQHTRPRRAFNGTFCCSLLSFQSRVVGVGHPVVSVADVRSTDARRRERDTPEGVTHAFHVSLYKVDPRICVLARNLLSKESCRLSLRDEVLPGGP